MNTTVRSALLLGMLFMTGCTHPTKQPDPKAIVDLTHPFSEQTLYWPNADGFRLEKVFDGTTDNGYHYSANRYQAAEHGGTHMDAPIHFFEGGETVEKIPLDKTIGPGIVVDVSAKALKDKDYLVSIEDLIAFETLHGPIEPQSIVLLRTGYDRFWPSRARYLGTAERGQGAIAKLHFPGLSPAAAAWLVKERRVRAVGLDTASIDRGLSRLFESHRIFAAAGVPIFENLMQLDQLPAKAFEVIALPMKIEGGSGAPLRVIARPLTP